MIPQVTFAQKEFLWALLIIPFLIATYVLIYQKKQTNILFSSFQNFPGYKPSFRQRLRHLPFILWTLACVLIIIALARPQSSSSGQNVSTEGIDIVMALDISASMLAEDFKPNRIEAAKRVAEQFIDARPTDRIGLVIFSGESFTQCPITSDHAVLKNLFSGRTMCTRAASTFSICKIVLVSSPSKALTRFSF